MLMDKEALPKRITRDNVSALAGEHAYWFCPACHKWRTSPITAEGIICSVCGGGPDWEKRPPTLAYRSRFRRVQELCAEGSDWRNSYDEAEQEYRDFIEATYRGMPAQTKRTGWRHFSNAWKVVGKLSDYLLTALDVPIRGIPYAYDEEGLQRKYFDSSRDHNVVTLSDVGIKPMFDDGGVQFTAMESLEIMAFDPADCERYTDKYFQHWYLEGVKDPLERDIAYCLSVGERKRDIEAMFGLSEQQVKTICKHLKDILDEESLKSA